MTNIFADIALILALSTVLAAIFSRLKQPIILAYLLVGIITASSGIFEQVTKEPTFEFFAELGIAFALFLIGLELKFSDIKQIGRAAILLGVGQVIFTTAFGFLISYQIFRFSGTDSFYLGLALTFSSTLIVVKLLAQKRDLDSLYGKIATGYLIVQDFIAIATLILITSVSKGGGAGQFAFTALEGLALVFIILVLNRYVLQSLFSMLAKNTEVLFLSGVSWALIFSAASVALGFSIEIGAFLAGLGLARLREERQLASWIRPLRDLFVTIFFLSLGLRLPIDVLATIIVPTLLLSAFVLIGNPLIMMVIMGTLGFRRRTSFHVSITSAQVSEFSLIFIVLAYRFGLINEKVVNLTTATALVTIVLSTYLIVHSSKIFRMLSPYLKIFERKMLAELPSKQPKEFADHVVLVGVGRLGLNILKALRERGIEVLTVEFNPTLVKNLEMKGLPVIYGDISDPEIFEQAGVKKAKLLLSTVFDYEDTLYILQELKRLPKKISVVVTSPEGEKALEFYQQGADYVIVPRILSSHVVEKILIDKDFAGLKEGILRKKHIEELSLRDMDGLEL